MAHPKYTKLYSFGSCYIAQNAHPVKKFQPQLSPPDRIPKPIPDHVSLATLRRQHTQRINMVDQARCEYTHIILVIESGYLSLRDFMVLAQSCKMLYCFVTSDYIYSRSLEYSENRLTLNQIYEHTKFDSMLRKKQKYIQPIRFRICSHECESYKEKPKIDDIDDSDVIYRLEDFTYDEEEDEDDEEDIA